ncbi:MAG: 2-oxo acid dehydrogenase subunit E2, partial [Candidatus Nanopelagicales bacterium]
MAQESFGTNEWLVDEIYQQYLNDRTSVDPAWWDFFADYTPADGSAAKAQVTHQRAVEAAAESAKPPTEVAATPAAPPPAGEMATLRGPAARVVANMEASLAVPTATSVRGVPAKLLIDNRVVINNHLARGRGGKVSFTHIIGYALIRALRDVPAMNASYAEVDGKPAVVMNPNVNLGVAIDLAKPDGSRQLLVPNIKAAQDMDFAGFWSAYEDVIRRARSGSLGVDDFVGTTLSLTNPGTIGTEHSVPRLMNGQGCIVGVGAMDYPAEWQGASEESLVRNAVSKTITLTSTYDHRIIQGAQSGEFLRRISQLLLGEDHFYDEIFRSLRIPYEPIRWAQDLAASHETDLNKTVRVQEVIHAYR